jgi:hypothetical protein
MIAPMLSVLGNMLLKSIRKELQSSIGSEMDKIQKPTTVLMDEFKEKFIDLLNNAELPAWVVLYLLDPFIK